MEIIGKLNNTDQLLIALLENFIKVSPNFKSAIIFDRDGLIMASASKNESDNSEENEEMIGAISGVVELVLERIGREYKLGKYGVGSFETEDYRLVFAESGRDVILVYICDFDLTMNIILPFIFLVGEKIVRVIEDDFGEGFTLNIPDLGQNGILQQTSSIDIGDELECEEEDEITINFLKTKVDMCHYKVIVLGDPSVGKTSLINRFALDKFNEDYLPTLGISITEEEYEIMGTENSRVKFMIWDLAGQSFFKRARKLYVRDAQSAFLVYDVTKKDSFLTIEQWRNEVIDEDGEIPFILVANKIDLIEERVISEEEGRTLAGELNCSYIETSAKTAENVRELFKLLGIGLFFLLR